MQALRAPAPRASARIPAAEGTSSTPCLANSGTRCSPSRTSLLRRTRKSSACEWRRRAGPNPGQRLARGPRRRCIAPCPGSSCPPWRASRRRRQQWALRCACPHPGAPPRGPSARCLPRAPTPRAAVRARAKSAAGRPCTWLRTVRPRRAGPCRWTRHRSPTTSRELFPARATAVKATAPRSRRHVARLAARWHRATRISSACAVATTGGAGMIGTPIAVYIARIYI
mmetsp:Transcript_17518/g.50864  ORF Transcript_17518/g.50864 Transcript_17518/m.50864 type:complete len:227 (-) Transcript_17518:28-708(-)